MVARGAEHVPGAGQELGELRQLAADQDGSDRRRLQRRHRARHARLPQRRQRPEPVPRARRRALHAAARGVDPAGHHARLGDHAGAGSRLHGARRACCRARCSTSPTRRSSSARRSRSRRSGRSTRSRSATAGAARSPRRCSSAFFDIINGEVPDRHGWLTYVYPGEPLAGRSAPRRPRGARAERSARRGRAIRAMHINDLLKIAVASGASDLHLKVGSYPMMRVNGTLVVASEEKRLDRDDTEAMAQRALLARAPREVPDGAGSRPRLQRRRPRPLPLQRLPAARHRRPGPARHPDARSRPIDELGLPPVLKRIAAGRARPGAGHRHHRQRQEHDARGDDRPHQLDARGAHHDGRGSDRVPAPRPPVDRQPARGGGRHAVVRARAAQRAAAGPRRHPGRRDARLRDGRDRRCSPPRPATSCSRRCTRSTRPKPSTASSRSFRRTSSGRSGCSSRRVLKAAISQRLHAARRRPGPRRRRSK